MDCNLLMGDVMPGLQEVTPTQQNRVIDLVRDAGIDVSDWANFRGRNPATNPKYCYEWAFSDGKRVVVLNLWLDKMKEEGSDIIYRMNLRDDARAIARTRGQSSFVGRATRMDEIVRKAYKYAMPVHVIICDGKRKDVSDAKSSQVKKRILDPKNWAVTFYDDITGDCVLTRGAILKRVVDQFDLLDQVADEAKQRIVSRNEYIRSREVRSRVLIRSRGRCELCDSPGFQMSDGSIFMETHHVVPLSENGADIDTNVVALCPNHHREAHYGQKREELRVEFLARLQ
jgi:hypothetical protein